MKDNKDGYIPIAEGFGWFSLLLGAIALVTIATVIFGEFYD